MGLAGGRAGGPKDKNLACLGKLEPGVSEGGRGGLLEARGHMWTW